MTLRHEIRYKNAIARNITNAWERRHTFTHQDGTPLKHHEAKHRLGIRLNDTSLDTAVKELLA